MRCNLERPLSPDFCNAIPFPNRHWKSWAPETALMILLITRASPAKEKFSSNSGTTMRSSKLTRMVLRSWKRWKLMHDIQVKRSSSFVTVLLLTSSTTSRNGKLSSWELCVYRNGRKIAGVNTNTPRSHSPLRNRKEYSYKNFNPTISYISYYLSLMWLN